MLLNKHKTHLKYCQNLEVLTYFETRFRSFNTGNMGSVGQRAVKLPALKVGGLKKKYANSAITAEACAIVIGPGSNLPGFESFPKFGRWQLCSPLTYTDPILPVLKDLNLLSRYVKSSRGWQHCNGRFCSLKVPAFS